MPLSSSVFNHAGFNKELKRLGLTPIQVSSSVGYRSTGPVTSWIAGLGEPNISQLCVLMEMGFSLTALATAKGRKLLAAGGKRQRVS